MLDWSARTQVKNPSDSLWNIVKTAVRGTYPANDNFKKLIEAT